MARAEIESTLRAYAKAWAEGDVPRLIDFYDDAIILRWRGRHALAGDHVGKPAALAALAELARRTGRELLEVVDVMAGAAFGVMITREALGHGAGRVEVERTLVFRVGDGRLLECRVHESDPDLIDSLVGD